MGRGTLGSNNLLSIVLFGSVDVLLIAFAGSAPLPVLVVTTLMLAGGAIVFVYGLTALERCREVFGCEPTVLTSQPSTGRAARSTRMTMNAVGVWSFLAGGILRLPLLRIF